jgi:hypothetical protein
MSNSNWLVQGFLVDSFSVKKDKIKIVLVGDKDDIVAQMANLGDILSSLEAHVSSDTSIELSVGRCNASDE